MAHTPGPWVIYPETNGTEICAVDMTPGLPIRQLVATAQGTNWIANARLIAAAPELLGALKVALGALKTASRQLTEDHKAVLKGAWGGSAIEAAEAAIAKAEGRS
jgi:hypothetical protein